jgi:ligand-binding SRPBCC domain-containing protein
LSGRARSERTLVREQFFPHPVDVVFEPFASAENLQAITPPWLHFRIVSALPIEMREGALIEYQLRFHGVPVRWRTEIVIWDPPHRFVDLALHSPFALWHHTHTFDEVEGGTLARDIVRYRVGLGPLGELAHALVVGRDLRQIFDFRREAVRDLIGSPSAR